MDLGKQMGPLPMGAWVAVIGTGIGIALWSQRSQGAAVTQSTDTTTGLGQDPGVGTGVDGQWVDVSPPIDQGITGAPTTNEEWGSAAINYLIAQNYNPAASQSAITKALQGLKMSVREYALWTVALGHLGAPPYPVDVTPPVPHSGGHGGKGGGGGGGHHHKPHSGKPPKQVTKRWYVVKPGDTLHSIARRVYGDASKAQDIFQANHKGARRPDKSLGWVVSPNSKLTPGRRLFIPGSHNN